MILAVVQARMSSRRLPGKVTLPILGKPMLVHQIERIRHSSRVNNIVVATSTMRDDDAIADLCRDHGIDSFRGSLHDVLDRFYQAAKQWQPRLIVRLTADCPLIDWQLIDATIEFLEHGDFDYASNTIERSWPDGLDVEVMTPGTLEQAWHAGRQPEDREHVTPFVYSHPERFRLGSYAHDEDMSAHRWTVDNQQDFEFVTDIFAALYPGNPRFLTDDILDLLAERPDLAARSVRLEQKPV